MTATLYDELTADLPDDQRQSIAEQMDALRISRDDPALVLLAAGGYTVDHLRKQVDALHLPDAETVAAAAALAVRAMVRDENRRAWRRVAWLTAGLSLALLAAITAALWLSMRADYERRLSGALAGLSPPVAAWAVENPGAVAWAMTERAERLRDIDRRYRGPAAGARVPFPCLDRGEQAYTAGGEKLTTCVVVTR